MKRSSKTRWLREPLVHFLILGGVLFLLWPFIAERIEAPSNHIVISSGRVQRAVELFAKTHMRAPSKEEVAMLLEQEVETELYVREALALGLDRDDEIIRRRLAQKMRFLSEDLAQGSEPSDADLETFFARHRGQFAPEMALSFSQVYLSPDHRADAIESDAAQLLELLNAGDGRIDYASMGDTLPVQSDFELTSLTSIGSLFGRNFAADLRRQVIGRWVGPIRSGYGVHLVLLRERRMGAAPSFPQVSDDVRRAWHAEERAASNLAYARQLREKYSVRIEAPADPSAAPAASLAAR